MSNGDMIDVPIGINGPSIANLWALKSPEYQKKVTDYLNSLDESDMDSMVLKDDLLSKIYHDETRELIPASEVKDISDKITNCEIIKGKERVRVRNEQRELDKAKARSYKMTIGIAEDFAQDLKGTIGIDLTIADNFTSTFFSLARSFRLTDAYPSDKERKMTWKILHDYTDDNDVIAEDVIKNNAKPIYKDYEHKSVIHSSWLDSKDIQYIMLFILVSYIYGIYKLKKKDVAIFQSDMLWISTLESKLKTSKFAKQRKDHDFKNTAVGLMIQDYVDISIVKQDVSDDLDV